jgi:hypothetical protein
MSILLIASGNRPSPHIIAGRLIVGNRLRNFALQDVKVRDCRAQQTYNPALLFPLCGCQLMRLVKFCRTVSLVGVLAGASAGLAVAQEAIGMKLEAAGFVMREANTPRKMARLKTLPPHKFVRRMKNGVPYYIYADPTYCKCALIGNQDAMNSYRDMVRPIAPPPGYRDFAGNISGSGESVERDILNDMSHDGDAQMEDDIFHLGL